MKDKKSQGAKNKAGSNPNDRAKASDIEKKVAEIVGGAVNSLGFILWSVGFSKTDGDWTLSITIDKDEQNEYISMDDCVNTHKLIDPLLDAADPIPGQYMLEISSPGLNRELKTDAHLNRYTDKNIILKLYAKDAALNKKIVSGKLLSFDNSNITIDSGEEGGTLVFERKAVAHICADDDIE